MRQHENYDGKRMQADVWDVAGTDLPPGLTEGSTDVVIMIFVFSALAPPQWEQAVRNVYKILKPGGCVLFRDYGRGDLAQVRFKKGRWMEENFYVRGDGTRVYFFEKEELRQIWTGLGLGLGLDTTDKGDEKTPDQTVESSHFEIEDLGVDKRLLVNRQRKLKMYRCWLQGKFRKPLHSGPESVESHASAEKAQQVSEKGKSNT
jgi:tRNAThr (cytosine32-N3)-methyltransferase